MDALAQRLRSERERQKLSVRDLAVVTKIREPYIQAVERGAYDVLPAVYVRSFVRTLGTSLGIPSAEIHSLMDDVFDIDEDSTERIPRSKPPEPERPDLLASTANAASQAFSNSAEKAGKALSEGVNRLKGLGAPSFFQKRPRGIYYVGAAIVLLLVIVGAWWLISGSGSGTEDTGTPRNEIDVGGMVDSLSLSAEADSMELRAEVEDTAWLTITMDGTRTRQLVLEPGTTHQWNAAERFKLSLSNAGAVKFYRDQEALPMFGQRGQAVREVVITRTDVISSTRPVETQQRTATPQRQRRRAKSQREREMPLITPAPTQNPSVRPNTPR